VSKSRPSKKPAQVSGSGLLLDLLLNPEDISDKKRQDFYELHVVTTLKKETTVACFCWFPF
jgi:hypothetical protein